MASNRFIETIRENLKRVHDGDNCYGKWAGFSFQERVFLRQCADYMEMLENELEKIYKEKFESEKKNDL